MGLGDDGVKLESLNEKKDNGLKKKKEHDDDDVEESCCWFNFRFVSNCMTSRSKVDNSLSGLSNHEIKSTNDTSKDQPVAPVILSTTTSNSSSAKLEEELKVSSRLRKFAFNDVKLATRNFRPESLLGEGGFGCVFKGWIEENGTAPVKPGTGLTVAVKTLNHDGLQGHKEWLAEVTFLGDLVHPNLVKLVGYCIEDDQRLLVYEFMSRGSLENHLFRRSLPLPWSIRMKIALGAAKGLAFLHEEAERPVIYRDFKTSNILLDAEYNAKLSDFGLAKDAPDEGKTHVSTRVMGTYGYAAPEYVMTVVEVLENLAYLANASNLVLYLSEYMHFSLSESANSVTNFMGTAFLLSLLGGFLSDAFFTTYHIYLISAVIEFLGLVILTVQANLSSLMPPKCDPSNQNTPCQEVDGAKAAMLFLGLYLVALGVGGIKGSLPAHGAEQFDESTPQGRKQRSTFFNYFVFSLSFGALIAVTLVVWIEDNKGWKWGFGFSTLTILLSIPVFLSGSRFYKNKIPYGSPLTTILKVLTGSVLNSCMTRSPSNAVSSITSPSLTPTSEDKVAAIEEIEVSKSSESPSQSLGFLNRAVVNKPAHNVLKCSVQQVEEVKIVIKILPIFACTIMLNCCLAQLSTFSVQQAATMNTHLGSLKVPPASLPVFPVVFIMILAPLYDHVIIPFARKVTKSEMGISHLQRIGIGLILSIASMAIAALVEIKRKRVATHSGMLDSTEPLPITFFWIAFQYLFLGSADLFTLAGLMEFFFTEAPFTMRSLATSLSFASLAMGYYLSTVIVSIVNSITGVSNHKPWLSGANLNHYHLERFYWLICALSALNFLHYLFWAMKYKYRLTGSSAT